MQCLFATVVPKYLNCATFPKLFIGSQQIVILSYILVTKHNHIYLVFSAFISGPVSFLDSIKALRPKQKEQYMFNTQDD
jgi:hypothetical protein